MIRVGIGYDIHGIADGRPLILGGIHIPSDRGLAGHSDADVMTHALMDAMLGAAALGDIGIHFPDSDDQYRDISSLKLLKRVVEKVKRRGFQIGNVDISIIAEYPKIAPFRQKMIEKLAEILEIQPDRVSVKATTHEGFDATGRGEAIAAHAIVCLTGDPE